jgi:uncharacterized protein YcfL
MKRLLAMGLLSLGLLAGCNEPIPAWQDQHGPVQVSMTDVGLQWKVRVGNVATNRVGAGQLQVSMQVFNTTGDDLTVDYKYWFTDKAGVQVEDSNGLSWIHQRIPPHGYVTVTFTSMGSTAEDFRVQFRAGDR